MKKIRAFLILSVFTVISCTSDTQVDDMPSEKREAIPGIPLITFSSSVSGSSGSSSGSHIISYQNYPTSKVLKELCSPHPIQLPDGLPRQISIDYYFPELNLDVAKSRCLSAIADSLQLKTDTLSLEYDIYTLSATTEKASKAGTGTNFSRTGSTIAIQNASLTDIAMQLSRNTNLHFTVADDLEAACCFSVELDINRSEDIITQRLQKQGFELEKDKQQLPTIRLVSQ